MPQQTITDAAQLGYLGNYHHRMKRAARTTYDAAGLPSTGKYKGKETPVKGKGCPPPERKEANFRLTKRFIDGRSHDHHEVVPLASNSRPTTSESTLFRPSKRFIPDTSFQSHMGGTGVLVLAVAEPGIVRKSRASGAASPRRHLDATSQNIFNIGSDSQDSSPNSSRPPSPRTGLKCTMPCPQESTPVLHYRYSGGICSDTYKLHTERVPSPINARLNLAATRSCYFDAWSSYSMNRMRAQGSGVVFG